MDHGTHQASEVKRKADTNSRRRRVGFLKSILTAFGSPSGPVSSSQLVANQGSGNVSRSIFGIPDAGTSPALHVQPSCFVSDGAIAC